MTESEALRIVANPHLQWKCVEVDSALTMVRNALEKQIAKKLEHGVCPNCSTNNDKIIKHLGNPQAHKNVYCWNCGQKLDWSEV